MDLNIFASKNTLRNKWKPGSQKYFFFKTSSEIEALLLSFPLSHSVQAPFTMPRESLVGRIYSTQTYEAIFYCLTYQRQLGLTSY